MSEMSYFRNSECQEDPQEDNDLKEQLARYVNPNLDEGGGGGICPPPSWFFEHSSETVRSRKLKLSEFDFLFIRHPFK